MFPGLGSKAVTPSTGGSIPNKDVALMTPTGVPTLVDDVGMFPNREGCVAVGSVGLVLGVRRVVGIAQN